MRSYNEHAKEFAAKFDEIGVRAKHIDEVFRVFERNNLAVVEIGFGNGRDAEEILKRTDGYVGIDLSPEFVAIARERVPSGRFELADVEDYSFPPGTDIVFAFASLIHVPKESLRNILSRIFSVLNPGGVAYLSMKYRDSYGEVTHEDEYGTRTFYLYSEADIREITDGFDVIKCEVEEKRGRKWLEVMLQKPKQKISVKGDL
jgi:trans-aconitate methyltransferase